MLQDGNGLSDLVGLQKISINTSNQKVVQGIPLNRYLCPAEQALQEYTADQKDRSLWKRDWDSYFHCTLYQL